MPKLSPCSITLSCVVLLLWFTSGQCAMKLKAIWQDAQQGGEYTAPTRQDIRQAEELFSRLLKRERPETLQDDWLKLGFILEKVLFKEKRYWVLHERPDQKQGRGLFFFSPDSTSNSLLMAPHGQKDVGTGYITFRIFQDNDFAVAAFNTVPRYKDDEGGVRLEYDLGKLPTTYFTALSRAFAATFTEGRVLQLHGFALEKRTSDEGAEAAIILSGGSETVRHDILVLRECLQQIFPEKVLIYPRDVQELGGTTNITGKILRQGGNNGFVHVEMSREIRDRLRKNHSLRQPFGSCLEKMQD